MNDECDKVAMRGCFGLAEGGDCVVKNANRLGVYTFPICVVYVRPVRTNSLATYTK